MVFGSQIQNLALFLSLCESFHPTRFRQRCGGFIPMVLFPIGFLRFRSRFETVRFLSRHLYEFAFSKSKKRFQTWIWDPGETGSDCTEHRIQNHLCPDFTPSIPDAEESRRRPFDFPEWIIDGILTRSFFGAFTGYNNRINRSTTSVTFYIDVGICFPLLIISFGTREMLKFQKRDIILRFEDVVAIPQSDQTVASAHGVFVKDPTSPLVMFSSPIYDDIDRDHFACLMDLWVYQFGLCWIELANLHVGLVNHWRQGFVGFAQIGRLENALATLRWVLIDMRGSGIWDDIVKFVVVMLKKITQSQYFKETLVRKCWCHYVYISELALDTSALMLRFVKRSHSHKLLYTIRNKEESNMKLDNNRSFDRLASKATLRKASSNSLLLYFLPVYGTYICVCNNCVSIILYDYVITLLD